MEINLVRNFKRKKATIHRIFIYLDKHLIEFQIIKNFKEAT